MNQTSQHVVILDVARGVCAFIVALFHFLHFESPQGSLFDTSDPFLNTIAPFMPGIVCVFFLISGYVLFLHLERSNYQLRNYGHFLLKRVIRLQLPLLACVLLILCINAVFQWYNGIPFTFSWNQFLSNITLTANFTGEAWYNPIFWTLSIELQFYVFIGLTFLLIRKSPFPWLLGLSVLAFALNCFCDTRGTVVEFGSYFTIGISMYLFHQKRFELIYILILSAIGILDFQVNQAPLYYISSVLFIPIILFLSFRSRIIEFAGEVSFSFYLIHGAVGGLFLYFTARYADQFWQKLGLLIIALLISYAVGYIFYLLIEKTSARLGKKITYRRNN
ncbi:MAG: acyltransferase family protein [Crocinitomicaceae bacterium]